MYLLNVIYSLLLRCELKKYAFRAETNFGVMTVS